MLADDMAAAPLEKRTAQLRRLVPLLILVALAGLAFAQGWHRYLTLATLAERHEALQSFVAANHVWAVAAFVGVYAAVVALSLPGGAILTVTGGFLFGWLIGGLAAVVGATTGATLVFLAARTALGEPLARSAGPWLAKLRQGFKEDAWSYLLFLRLVPAFPFWLVNLAPALLDVPLKTYVLATAIGIVPGTFAFSVVGSGLGSVIEAERAAHAACIAARGAGNCPFALHLKSLVSPGLLAAFAALGLMALVPVAVKRIRAYRARA
jgi:uncharacterized membrane protein YdjX (TVP38/TMEM64 family)